MLSQPIWFTAVSKSFPPKNDSINSTRHQKDRNQNSLTACWFYNLKLSIWAMRSEATPSHEILVERQQINSYDCEGRNSYDNTIPGLGNADPFCDSGTRHQKEESERTLSQKAEGDHQ